MKFRWPPLQGWIKINIDASRRQGSKATSIGFVMRDNHTHVIVAKGKRLEIVVSWWLSVRRYGSYSHGYSE